MTTSRRTRKILMTAAMNAAAYGTDAIAAGTGAPILTRGLEITPLEGEEIDRELDNGQMGNTPALMVGTHVKASGSVEIAGAGTAGNAPAYSPIINCSGFNGLKVTSVFEFTRPTDGSEKDATFYIYKDGAIHRIRGARATFSTKMTVGEIATFDFEITGLYGGIVTGAVPTADFTGFIKPVKVGATSTTFKIGAATHKMLSFELAENNEITFDENTVEEAVYLTDFKPDGTFTIEAPALATFDPFTVALSEATQALTITHGTTAGNIVEISLPTVQLGRPTYGDKDGRVTYEIPFRVIGGAYKYTVK